MLELTPGSKLALQAWRTLAAVLIAMGCVFNGLSRFIVVIRAEILLVI